MLFFRIFLFAIIFVVGAYTFPVVMDYGLLSLFPNFFGEIRQLSWQGQFNLDFFTFLLLSGFWLVWRNQFSPLGFVLGLGGVLLGAPYLALYLDRPQFSRHSTAAFRTALHTLPAIAGY